MNRCRYCGATFTSAFRVRTNAHDPEPSLEEHLMDCDVRRRRKGDERRADIAARTGRAAR